MSSFRKERVQDLLLSFLAEEVRRCTDPRLEFVTLTAVEVSNDLRAAKVYWTNSSVMENGEGKAASQADVQKALKGAGGMLKRRIAEELTLRYVPELNFKYDESVSRASRIDELLGRTKL